MNAAERLLEHLELVKQARANQWTARCPAHPDRTPSLSVTRIEGAVLIHCHAGCTVDAILDALRLTRRDLFDSPRGRTYEYADGTGHLFRQVHRSAEKDFRQTIADGSRVILYRLPAVEAAVAAGEAIYIAEGEKDADALVAAGVVATSAPMGAGNWSKADYSPLAAARRVVVVADRDEPGLARAEGLSAYLTGHGVAEVQVVLPAEGKDAADHIAAGHTVDELTPWRAPQRGEPDPFEEEVRAEANRIRIRDAARALVATERLPPAPPFDIDTLGGVLTRAPAPPFRVARMIPADASTLFSAMRKSGKTTSTLNLADCLITGKPFLDEFEVQPVDGDVAFLNFEVSPATVAGWAEAIGIDRDRLHLVNLRGRRNPLAHDDDRQQLGALLRARGIESVIVDPLTRAFTGDNQNDASQMGAFLNTLDVFVRTDVGARDLILTAHTGWDDERSRGSSEIEGWADSIVRLFRGKDGDTARYIRAEGRDVDIEEQQLEFLPDSHRLTLSGHGSRTEAKRTAAAADLRAAVLEFVLDNPGCAGEDIRTAVTGGKARIDDARRALVASGHLVEEARAGRGGGKCYFLGNPANSANSATARQAESPNFAAAPYRRAAAENEFGEGLLAHSGRGSSLFEEVAS